MANFKQIIAMCLDGASYAQITHVTGSGFWYRLGVYRVLGVRVSGTGGS